MFFLCESIKEGSRGMEKRFEIIKVRVISLIKNANSSYGEQTSASTSTIRTDDLLS